MASELKQRGKKPNQKAASGIADDGDHKARGSPNKLPKTPKTEKFGSIGIKKEDQLWSRAVLMTGVLVIVIVLKWRKGEPITWVSNKELLTKAKAHPVTCAPTFLEEINKFDGCGIKQCGRFVIDNLFTDEQLATLLALFNKGLRYGGSSGGASILDLHSGALSKDEQFINVHSLGESIWTEAEMGTYRAAKDRVKTAIAEHFKVDLQAIHLASPTFFSRMTADPAKTVHDEYWHPHVDKETYETFHFTSLLYLNDYATEFQGGRFVFVDTDRTNRTVEPRKGRVSMFTSGAENLHFVEKVTSGVRYALTIAFTCDAQKAIADPHVR